MDPRRRVYGIEWPTVGLILATYAAWAGITLFAASLSLWLAVPVLTLVLVLHSSLQHESIHGHPAAAAKAWAWAMTPGVGLFIPYARFRDLHLAHHKDANLTDPYDDPESFYFDPEHFWKMPRPVRWILQINNTFAGRILIGPLVGIEGFYRTEWQLIRAGSVEVRRAWAIHLASVAVVLTWLLSTASMPVWAYVLSAYAALSILKIRTFCEHQASEAVSARSVIIDDRGFLAFLFLNNNLHSVHHASPGVAWYDLSRLFRDRRDEYLKRNRGYYFSGYGDVARRFLFTPKEEVPHPLEPKART